MLGKDLLQPAVQVVQLGNRHTCLGVLVRIVVGEDKDGRTGTGKMMPNDRLPEPNEDLHLTQKTRARKARKVMTLRVEYNLQRCLCWKWLVKLM